MRWLASVGIAVAGIAACGARPSGPMAQRQVDLACLDRSRQGTMLQELPAQLSGFAVTVTGDTVWLHRSGHEIDAAMYERLAAELFKGGGIASGGPTDANLQLSIWNCQRSVADIAAAIANDNARTGLSDAALDVDLFVLDVWHPAPRTGPEVLPQPHYSRSETYDPSLPRISLDQRDGHCDADEDCRGGDSNSCSAWYLRGGAEIALYEPQSMPTFCGCIDNYCTWFEQHQWR